MSSERNQVVDWLHRGRREPLASMGMYVYSMCVYFAQLDPDAYTDNDFVVYRFADTHPSAGKRVQKLRVDEMFKVPRLFGFTMPRESFNAEQNVLFKSVLFRPIFARGGNQVEDFMQLVDSGGSFLGPWKHWYQLQRTLADRFHQLQGQAGKLFTIEDIDTSVHGYSSDPLLSGRQQPSAAEFVARWVVEVLTHMDMTAESRSRARQPCRPDP
eukprot:848030-Karenia_brevis.AAC.1